MHVLVGSCLGDTTPINGLGSTYIKIEKDRLVQDFSGWYFIEVFYPETATFKSFYFISNALVHYLNRHHAANPFWMIPLALCQPYALIQQSVPLDLYQEDILSQKSTIATTQHTVIRAAIEARSEVFTWFQYGPEFKQQNPLCDRLLKYTGVSDVNDLRIDSIVYQLLLYALLDVPSAKTKWIQCETELFKRKLHQRPDMYKEICRMVNCSPASFENALASIPQVHEDNYQRVLQADGSSPFAELSQLTSLARELHHRLVQYTNWQCEDKQVSTAILSKKKADRERQKYFKVNDNDPMPIPEIEECAPLCMKPVLKQAMGTVQEQASLPGYRRRHLIHFLMELDHKSESVSAMLRPKTMIEYETEKPKQSWSNIQQMIHRAQSDRQLYWQDHNSHHQGCDELMDAGMCPYLARAPVEGEHSKSYTDKKRTYFQRVKSAKLLCQDRLNLVWANRELRGFNKNKKPPIRSNISPYTFAIEACGGAGADIHTVHDKSKIIVSSHPKPAQSNKRTTTLVAHSETSIKPSLQEKIIAE